MSVTAAPEVILPTELRPPLAHHEALLEADRCLACGGPYAVAPCTAACPAEVAADALTDCPVGRGHEPRLMPKVLNAAVDCLFWPLYEVVDGQYALSHEPEHPIRVADWLKLQTRFAHLLRPEQAPVLERIQAQVESDWDDLYGRCAA